MNDLIGMKPHWINTKVEFIWDGSQYVEHSVEGYWYEGEITFCANYDSSHTGAVIDAAVTKATPTSLGTSEVSKCVTVDASGDLIVPDSDKFKFGAGSDMQLYHDGSNSFIQQSGTGALKLATEDSGKAVSIGHTTSETTVNDNLTVTGDLVVTGSGAAITSIAGTAANQILTDDGDGTVTSEANLTFDGTDLTVEAGDIVFGTAGKGICLGVTSNTDSNTLDDYEEGTWTPVLSDGSNNATADTAVGTYTKIGNLVTLRWIYTCSSLGSVSGSTRITGLPFTPKNTASNQGVFFAGYGGGLAVTAGQNVSGYCNPNQAYVKLILWDATTGATELQHGEVTADGAVTMAGQYHT